MKHDCIPSRIVINPAVACENCGRLFPGYELYLIPTSDDEPMMVCAECDRYLENKL
jgi:hypothetical protein